MMVADKFPNGLIGLIGLRIIGTFRTIVIVRDYLNGLIAPKVLMVLKIY